MSGFPRNRIASIGGSGVETLGGEIATLDSTGAVRNVVDDGSGDGTVSGTLTVDTAVINTNWRNPTGQTFGEITLSLANIQGQNGMLLSQSTSAIPVDWQSTTSTSGDQATTTRHEVRSSNTITGSVPEIQLGPPGTPWLAISNTAIATPKSIDSSVPQTTLTGSTAGSIVWSMPFQGSSYKRFIAYFDAYENDTTTAQTISYPTAFTETPVISTNSASVPGVTTTATELSIDPDTTTAYTGWVIVEGY